jgi:hypothetical protein
LQDPNDLHHFAQVVRHRGFSAVSRATGESKRVAQPERDLGVRPIERSMWDRKTLVIYRAEGGQAMQQSRSHASTRCSV